MATIRETKGIKETTYNVQIRKKNFTIGKTFKTKEDAEIYVFYKERLIDLMENFEVPIEKRVTIDQIFELKMKNLEGRQLNDFENCLLKLKEILPLNKFYHEISFDGWIDVAKRLYEMDVYRGGKTEFSKRKMSPNTLRRHFAAISSAVSNAQSLGIPIDNLPLKVIQSYITPLLKGQDNF